MLGSRPPGSLRLYETAHKLWIRPIKSISERLHPTDSAAESATSSQRRPIALVTRTLVRLAGSYRIEILRSPDFFKAWSIRLCFPFNPGTFSSSSSQSSKQEHQQCMRNFNWDMAAIRSHKGVLALVLFICSGVIAQDPFIYYNTSIPIGQAGFVRWDTNSFAGPVNLWLQELAPNASAPQVPLDCTTCWDFDRASC